MIRHQALLNPGVLVPRRRTIDGRDRCGSAYVVILVMSMMATVAGLSGLYVVRVQRRMSELTQHAAQARMLAVSAMDLGLFEVQNNPSWRADNVHDVWSTPVPMSGGAISFKFLDESDADLGVGPEGSVRLVGRAEVGDTIKAYSVQLGSYGPNLLLNGDMEGTTDWMGTGCTLQYTGALVNTGASSLYCKQRNDESSGLVQDVASSVTQGSTYYVEGWIWSWGSGTLNYRLHIVADTQSFNLDAPVLAGQFQKISGYIVANWTGSPSTVDFKISSVGDNQWFYLDDVVLQEVRPSTTPLEGTWRTEVDP